MMGTPAILIGRMATDILRTPEGHADATDDATADGPTTDGAMVDFLTTGDATQLPSHLSSCEDLHSARHAAESCAEAGARASSLSQQFGAAGFFGRDVGTGGFVALVSPHLGRR